MKITKKALAIHAQRLLETLEEEKISSLESALNAQGKKFKIREILPDYVHIFSSPSNEGTTALKISYICPNFESIPLELVINQALAYRQVIIKCEEQIAGYQVFASDDSYNLVQFKKSRGAEWGALIQDVGEISKLR